MPQEKKMLIIDDERDFCALVQMLMQRESFHVDCVHNLLEASQFLIEEHLEIILLDHNLSDGTGLDYFNQHRKDFDEAKIILITADPSLELKNREESAGLEFVAKSFGIKKIREIIKSVA